MKIDSSITKYKRLTQINNSLTNALIGSALWPSLRLADTGNSRRSKL